MIDFVSQIIDYENGELEFDQVVELFQALKDSGTIYGLQGSYHRTLNSLIEAGLVD